MIIEIEVKASQSLRFFSFLFSILAKTSSRSYREDGLGTDTRIHRTDVEREHGNQNKKGPKKYKDNN